jgi:RNA polymerase sigma-70 factor (ECF subfamily)
MRLRRIEKLIERTAKGDRGAFDTLYDKTSAKLFGVCLRVLNNRSAAEDALQDTFVKVWAHADKYEAKGLSPMTWLITIARNTSIDRLRRQKGRFTDLDTVHEQLAGHEPNPEALAIATSEAKKLQECLGKLEKDRAAAVRGAYLDGATYSDLALRFDVPLNTMRTWLRRSLIALRECMRA